MLEVPQEERDLWFKRPLQELHARSKTQDVLRNQATMDSCKFRESAPNFQQNGRRATLTEGLSPAIASFAALMNGLPNEGKNDSDATAAFRGLRPTVGIVETLFPPVPPVGRHNFSGHWRMDMDRNSRSDQGPRLPRVRLRNVGKFDLPFPYREATIPLPLRFVTDVTTSTPHPVNNLPETQFRAEGSYDCGVLQSSIPPLLKRSLVSSSWGLVLHTCSPVS